MKLNATKTAFAMLFENLFFIVFSLTLSCAFLSKIIIIFAQRWKIFLKGLLLLDANFLAPIRLLSCNFKYFFARCSLKTFVLGLIAFFPI